MNTTPKELARLKMTQERADVDQTLSAIQSTIAQLFKIEDKILGAEDKAKTKSYKRQRRALKRMINRLYKQLRTEADQWAAAVYTYTKTKEQNYGAN